MKGTNEKLGGGGIHHVAMNVYDINRSIAFYTDHFGFVEKVKWTLPDGRIGCMLDMGDGNYLEMFDRGKAPPPPAGTIFHFAIRVADLQKTLDYLRDVAGVKVTRDVTRTTLPFDPPADIVLAFVEGPDGESIELFQTDNT